MTEPIRSISGPPAVAFVHSCWHRDIVDRCRDAFLDVMSSSASMAVDVYEVPGAFELPLHAQLLCRSGRYLAVVAAGFVVDGGIYRHEFVAEAVVTGLMRVQLDTGVPVLSAVLTPHHFHEHDAHSEFFSQHMVIKGEEVAAACLATCQNIKELATVS